MTDATTEAKPEQNREWSRAEAETALRAILADSLGIEASELRAAASLVRDLGAESIDFLDIGFKIQQALGVNLQTAEIRTRILAWSASILPTLGEIVRERYGVAVAVDELRVLESGGLSKVADYLRTARGLGVGADAAEQLGRELVQRLVREFAALGFTVSQADREDVVRVMQTDLGPRRLAERTLDLLTVGALVDFVCARLGSRLRA
jgi:acyl carrier protein